MLLPTPGFLLVEDPPSTSVTRPGSRFARLFRLFVHELSDDGTLLLIDRFDLEGDRRPGFEDIASLMDLRVGGALTDRKYRGSYEAIARLVKTVCSDTPKALERFSSNWPSAWWCATGTHT